MIVSSRKAELFQLMGAMGEIRAVEIFFTSGAIGASLAVRGSTWLVPERFLPSSDNELARLMKLLLAPAGEHNTQQSTALGLGFQGDNRWRTMDERYDNTGVTSPDI